jgi:hypothetical protein
MCPYFLTRLKSSVHAVSGGSAAIVEGRQHGITVCTSSPLLCGSCITQKNMLKTTRKISLINFAELSFPLPLPSQKMG